MGRQIDTLTSKEEPDTRFLAATRHGATRWLTGANTHLSRSADYRLPDLINDDWINMWQSLEKKKEDARHTERKCSVKR